MRYSRWVFSRKLESCAGFDDTGAEKPPVWILWFVFSQDQSPKISTVMAGEPNKLICHPDLVLGAHLECNLLFLFHKMILYPRGIKGF